MTTLFTDRAMLDRLGAFARCQSLVDEMNDRCDRDGHRIVRLVKEATGSTYQELADAVGTSRVRLVQIANRLGGKRLTIRLASKLAVFYARECEAGRAY